MDVDALPWTCEQVGDVVQALCIFQPESGGEVTDGPKLALFSERARHLRFSLRRLLRAAIVGLDLPLFQRADLVGRQPFDKTGANAPSATDFYRGVELFRCRSAVAGGR